MDLLETTLKVVENVNADRENLLHYKENLKRYEEYIDKVKQNLEQTQFMNSRNKQILEINNLTKNAFNENLEIIKKLLGKVYNYTQQIDERLSGIINQENSLEESCNQTENHFTELETKYNNNIKLLEIMDKDSEEQIKNEKLKIEKQIADINIEMIKLNEEWNNLVDDHDNKRRTLETIILTTEILHDKLEKKQEEENNRTKLLQKQKDEKLKALKESNTDIEGLKEKIIITQEDIISLINNLKENLKTKEELLLEESSFQTILENINNDCKTTEIHIKQTEEKSLKTCDDIKKETSDQMKLITDKEEEFSVFKEKTNKINKDIEDFNVKIKIVDDELINLKGEYEKGNIQKQELLMNIENVSEENKKMEMNFEMLVDVTAQYENDLSTKQQELQKLESTPNPELLIIKDNIKCLEIELDQKSDLEKIIQETDLKNKTLQQTIEDFELNITNLKLKISDLEIDKDGNTAVLKNFNCQCDKISNEIKRLESCKRKEPVKLVPIPALKRFPSSQPNRKRPILDESDSSIDGEKMSFSEFVMRKKNIQQNGQNKKGRGKNLTNYFN